MDHRQSELCLKTLNNGEHENDSSNEDGKECSLLDLSEFIKWSLFPGETLYDTHLLENYNTGNSSHGYRQNRLGGSLQLSENNANLSIIDIPEEAAVSNIQPDSCINFQQWNPLDVLTRSCLAGIPPYVSDETGKETRNCSTRSGIYGSISYGNKSGNLQRYMSDYTHPCLFIIPEQNEIPCSTTVPVDGRWASNDSNTYALSDEYAAVSEYFVTREKGNPDIPTTTRDEENRGISIKESDKNIFQNYVKQSEPLDRCGTSDHRARELCNSGRFLVNANENCAAAEPQRSNEEVQRQQNDRPFVCIECGKSFRRKDALDIHYRIHTGEKPYGCDICSKRYISAAALASHHYTHTGEKPYVCDICQIGFTNSSHLTRHLRTHTGERPYGCSICGRTFTQRPKLNSHYKKEHNRK